MPSMNYTDQIGFLTFFDQYDQEQISLILCDSTKTFESFELDLMNTKKKVRIISNSKNLHL